MVMVFLCCEVLVRLPRCMFQDKEKFYRTIVKIPFQLPRLLSYKSPFKTGTFSFFNMHDLQLPLTLLQSLLPVWTHDGSPTTALQVNKHVEHFKNALANNPRFLQEKVKQYFKVS